MSSSSTAPKQSSRLAIFDPKYRYPASFNPYWKKVGEFKGRIFNDHGTEDFLGKWREQFPDSVSKGDISLSIRRPLHVEIGCNGGHVILEWAARAPLDAYIGIDWKFKQIYRGAEKAQKRSINNLLFFRAHAERLQFMFAPGEIDHLYLYFPDPWPKKSQVKNRFINPDRLRLIAGLVRPGGTFHIKTDHAEYFEWMEAAVSKVQDLWRVSEITRNLHATHPSPQSLTIPEVTLFEKLFIKDQIPIKSITLSRL